jgi:hypothetical protein
MIVFDYLLGMMVAGTKNISPNYPIYHPDITPVSSSMFGGLCGMGYSVRLTVLF